MANHFINIGYPFKNSPQGFFLNLNSLDADAIKSDLMHLLLTRKGERLYNPDFGTNLLKYIFEPNDNMTLEALKDEVSNTVKRYLPNLSIKNISVTESDESEYAAVIRIDYVITDNVFDIVDFVTIKV